MQRPLDILAVVGLVIAVANGVAFGLVLRARWFWKFFDSWEVPVFFTCFSLALCVACWWVSERVNGLHEAAAIAALVISAITSMVIIVLALVALIVMAALFLLENAGGKPRRSYTGRRSGRRSHRRR